MTKKRSDTHMEQQTMLKIHTMMYSGDREMQLLGLQTFAGHVSSYKHFQTFRGISLKGKPFFPFSLKMDVRKLGRELRKEKHIQENKAIKRGKILNNGRKHITEDSGNADRGQGDAKSGLAISV